MPIEPDAKDIAKDFLLEKIKSDIPKQFTTIFNYKFFYLARGIYQDNLETELTEVDQDIDYIIKKHIAEQYDVVSKQWDEIIQKDLNAESFEAEQQLKDLEKRLSEDPEDAKRYRWTQSKKAEKEGANLTNTTLEYLRVLKTASSPTLAYTPFITLPRLSPGKPLIISAALSGVIKP